MLTLTYLLTVSCLRRLCCLILHHLAEHSQQRRRGVFREHPLVRHRALFDHTFCSREHELLVIRNCLVEVSDPEFDDLLSKLQAIVHGHVDAISSGWAKFASDLHT